MLPVSHWMAGVCSVSFLYLTAPIAGESVQHVDAASCKQCHEEIYQQWSGSMHANSSALKDPIHGAFYKNVVGDPTQEDVKAGNGKYPVCLKCHAPVAAMEGSTKLDAKPAYAQGIGCTTCHSFSAFKGTDTPDGKPLYGTDAYEMDKASLYGPSGISYTTERTPLMRSGRHRCITRCRCKGINRNCSRAMMPAWVATKSAATHTARRYAERAMSTAQERISSAARPVTCR